jgi:lysophospholipase L1-like esterase
MFPPVFAGPWRGFVTGLARGRGPPDGPFQPLKQPRNAVDFGGVHGIMFFLSNRPRFPMPSFLRLPIFLSVFLAWPCAARSAGTLYDFDLDGKADLAVYHRATGDWYVRRSGNGQLLFQNWGWVEAVPVAADYDGDGITDFAVYHRPTGNWYIRQSSNGQLRFLNWGWKEATPVPGDYDGDGKDDIAVYHRKTGDWYIRQSSDNQTRFRNWGWSEARPVPADYDGDGKTDIAVFHPETGTWYILQSQTLTLRTAALGHAETRPVTGDFDGDGKDDLAVFVSAIGNWHILSSQNNTVQVQNFGAGFTSTVPADYDGDGKADIAVYHADTGNWFLRLSQNGAFSNPNWGWSEARPPAGYRHGALEGLRLLAMGDSITFGRGSSSNGPLTGYPILLERKLEAAFGGDIVSLNVGDPGETTGEGRSRLPGELNKHRPHVMCLMEGTNDEYGLTPVPPATTEANLRAMIKAAQSRGVFSVIATIPPVVPSARPEQQARIKAFNPRIFKIASSLGIPVARVYEYITAVPNWPNTLMDHGSNNHPNDAGYQRVRGAFFDALTEPINAGAIY